MNINSSIIVALVAGLVSIIVSLITAFLAIRNFKKRFKLEINEKYSEKLSTLRLENYPKAFEITGRILFNPKNRNTIPELIEIKDALRFWWVGPAALILSKKSVLGYYEFEKVLKHIVSTENFNGELANDLFEKNKKFRELLREDLSVLPVNKNLD